MPATTNPLAVETEREKDIGRANFSSPGDFKNHFG
jgi:hypothetical protein